MSAIDSMVKRANRLHRQTSNSGLEEEWAQLCSTAKDALLADLAHAVATVDDEVASNPSSGDDEPWVAEFSAYLEEAAEDAKQQFIRNGRRKRR